MTRIYFEVSGQGHSGIMKNPYPLNDNLRSNKSCFMQLDMDTTYGQKTTFRFLGQ
jgi:hypothetical protein